MTTATKQTQRTPGPWYVHTSADNYHVPVIVSREGRPVANDGNVLTLIVKFRAYNRYERANAAFIVRACNAHDDLLAALRSIAERYESGSLTECGAASIASAAITKVGA
jgi:hypothetical protein